MMPTDRLTRRSTIFDNKVNEKMAAAVMLNTPAMVVASRMESKVELIWSPNGGVSTGSGRLDHSRFFFGKRQIFLGEIIQAHSDH